MTFDDFVAQVRAQLTGKAATKGYSVDGPDGPNLANEFMAQAFPDHALGEIVYKALRYKAKGDAEDLIKIAAWAWLIVKARG